MPTETILRITYWGGWVSAALAIIYRLLVMLGGAGPLALRTGVFPYHFWQLSFLLFVICIATATAFGSKSS